MEVTTNYTDEFVFIKSSKGIVGTTVVVTTPPPYIAADRLRHRIRRGNPFCAFCYKNGEKSEIHSSHSLYYSKSSKCMFLLVKIVAVLLN